MLTGPDLGAAIKTAIELKKQPKNKVAAAFGVQPPSIHDWIKRGTISKEKLPALWAYFSDVVGPEHWGLKSYPIALTITPPPAAASQAPAPWPFDRVDIEKLRHVQGRAARAIENAILATAGDFEIDLRPTDANPRKIA